jgi:hypothetical protein
MDLCSILFDETHAVRANRRKICTARDERDIFSDACQPRTQVATDRTGSDYGKSHRPLAPVKPP